MLRTTQQYPFLQIIFGALEQEKLYLLPLRLFIGIGWLRAGLEKWLEPGWHDGTALAQFLTEHLVLGQIAFPFYAGLVQSVFEPASLTLGFTIMVCQFLVGLAVITGTFTNLALLGGLFMNLNFILVGELVPSTFYIMMQLVLLLSNIGAVLGLDYLLSKRIRFSFLVAKPASRHYSRVEQWVMGSVVILSFLATFSLLPNLETFGPASVHDPAMILFILSGFTSAFFLIALLQSKLASAQPSLTAESHSDLPLASHKGDTLTLER